LDREDAHLIAQKRVLHHEANFESRKRKLIVKKSIDREKALLPVDNVEFEILVLREITRRDRHIE
jgi:hypothetical protein